MRHTAKILTQCALIAWVVMMLFGCKSFAPPVNFYTLTPVSVSQNPDEDRAILRGAQIGIGPLKFPNVLDRPQIVTRPAPGRLEMAEFQRWGGYFKDDFLSVLASNISTLLGTDQVVTYPWSDKVKPAYRIEIEVHRFDGRLGDSVALHASWILKTPGQANNTYLKKSIIIQPVSGDDYDALVEAKSKALEKFSRVILDEMKKII